MVLEILGVPGTSPKMKKCPLKKIKVERNSSSNHHFLGDMLVCGGVSFLIDLVALHGCSESFFSVGSL